MRQETAVYLASASSARVFMLEKAGVSFIRDPANIDENALKEEGRLKRSSGERTALALAEEKARHVSLRRPDAIVIGSDQILECQGHWFDKPISRTEAFETLQKLRDRSHSLISAVVVTRNETCLWRFVDTARLTMRPFSDEFLRHYLDKADDGILESVGGYRIEGIGIQLFSHIEGDHFTILGMPLLPLLEFLREDRILET